ncbi:LysM peptidoglycan-binding domain-containing protein [Ostreibacterium oceani]|uniref:LysM peptidoglycan-binding domain-containing protein n=1 Tax=Ostreibacterium oceani TaxID=2654998 RepID=UPI00128C10A4|nr:LysM domain-containing protein [Ostreibacterium oceani]
MRNWLNSALILGTVALTACANNQTYQRPAETQSAPKQINIPATTVRVAPEYRTDAPDRYVVKKGDTLWSIAQRFLQSPARWKEIWHANPKLKNPHLIYPGDIITYTNIGGMKKLQVGGSSNPIRGLNTGKKTTDGRPIYNLSPTVRTETLAEPIPTVPKEIVYPFMTKNRVVEPGFSEDYAYIVGQSDGSYISLSGRSEVYAKGESFDDEYYDVFRESAAINDPITNEPLGVEATYVGQLRLVKEANEDGIASFMHVDSVNPLYPRDILIPTQEIEIGGDLTFLPKIPDVDEDAMVIKPMGAFDTQSGTQFNTLLINRGAGHGVVPGDVFKIVRASAQMGTGRYGEQFKLPDYDLGIVIVYHTYDDVSYALIMNAFDVIYPGDRLVAP